MRALWAYCADCGRWWRTVTGSEVCHLVSCPRCGGTVTRVSEHEPD